jgi:hypothetical protein
LDGSVTVSWPKAAVNIRIDARAMGAFFTRASLRNGLSENTFRASEMLQKADKPLRQKA